MSEVNKSDDIKYNQDINEDSLPTTHLKNDIKLSDLVGKGTTFEIDVDAQEDIEVENNYFTGKEILQHNFVKDCLSSDEDNDDENLSPFDKLLKKMVTVDPCGKVMKRIKEEGVGEVLPEKAMVTIHYNGYIEYQDEPFDSTYLVKRPKKFRLNDGGVILGLDIAVSSMKLYEISQFIIDPEYGFGKLGCLERIPPNSRLLFVVEVLNFIDSGAADQYELYQNNEKFKFKNVFKVAKALREKANNMFQKNIKSAIKDYNHAINVLHDAVLENIEEQNQQQDLLMKIYINLAVCYNKIDKPKKACSMCNCVYGIAKGSKQKLPSKLFFQHGRALFNIGEYSEAVNKLKKANAVDPNNSEIITELSKIQGKWDEYKKQELKFAKLSVSCITEQQQEQVQPSFEELSEEFINEVKDFCLKLKNDTESTQRYLPHGLSDMEIKCFEFEAKNNGLIFKTFLNENGQVNLSICK